MARDTRALAHTVSAALALSTAAGCKDAPTHDPGTAPTAPVLETPTYPRRVGNATVSRDGNGPPTLDTDRAPRAKPPRWLDIAVPGEVQPGLNLIIGPGTPHIADLEGRVLHRWPRARLRAGAALAPNGDIIVVTSVGTVARYSWEGRKRWEYKDPTLEFAHHDVKVMSSGKIMTVWRNRRGLDTLMELDAAGTPGWTWSFGNSMSARFAGRITDKRDISHVNSVNELPENPFYDAGDKRFRPGNLLVSARHLNTIFIVDRKTRAVVWDHTEDLGGQHDASMLERPHKHAGHIQVFNNNNSRNPRRGSEVLRIHPQTHQTTWRHGPALFFTSWAGQQQPLPNGNTLISSTASGRVFEVTDSGATVWQAFLAQRHGRIIRLPRRAAPQLAGFSLPRLRLVRTAFPNGYIDSDLYAFTFHYDAHEPILPSTRECRDVFLPNEPRISIPFGFAAARSHSPPETLFRATLSTDGGQEELLRVSVRYEAGARFRATAKITTPARQWAKFCLTLETPDGRRLAADAPAYFGHPSIGPANAEASHSPAPRSTAESAMDAEHLRKLGYRE